MRPSRGWNGGAVWWSTWCRNVLEGRGSRRVEERTRRRKRARKRSRGLGIGLRRRQSTASHSPFTRRRHTRRRHNGRQRVLKLPRHVAATSCTATSASQQTAVSGGRAWVRTGLWRRDGMGGRRGVPGPRAPQKWTTYNYNYHCKYVGTGSRLHLTHASVHHPTHQPSPLSTLPYASPPARILAEAPAASRLHGPNLERRLRACPVLAVGALSVSVCSLRADVTRARLGRQHHHLPPAGCWS